jgi:Tfp pilus assembly protein FimT
METGRHKNITRGCSAFTLIELILVMTIMVAIISLVVPRLKGFFQGRNLDNEALRFLALTRFGQSRAVNEGIPVELWVNQQTRSYGLEALSGYTETDTKPLTYKLDPSLQITLSQSSKVMVRSNYWSQTRAQIGAVTRIRFQPDGFISDASPQNIYLRQVPANQAEAGLQQGTISQVWIAEAPTHLEYDIKPAQLYVR